MCISNRPIDQNNLLTMGNVSLSLALPARRPFQPSQAPRSDATMGTRSVTHRSCSRSCIPRTIHLMSLQGYQMPFLSVNTPQVVIPECRLIQNLDAIIGQVIVGLICDRIGRKAALVITTLLIVIGATIGTAAHGANGSVSGLFWCLTFARGITGVVRDQERLMLETPKIGCFCP